MADLDDKARGIDDRFGDGLEPGSKMVFVPGDRGFRGVIVKPPEVIFDEEAPITPTKDFRNRQVRDQVKAVLEKAKNGQHYKDGYLEELQKQALKTGDAGSRERAEAIGELRVAQVSKDVHKVLDGAGRGRNVSDQSIDKLQERVLAIARQQEASDPGFPALSMVAALGQFRSSRTQSEAEDVLDRAGKGQKFADRDIDRLQQRLVVAGHQLAMFGQEGRELELAVALREIRRSELVGEAKDVLSRAQKGQAFTHETLEGVQQRLLGAGRQGELLGRDSEEMALAVSLGEVRRSMPAEEKKSPKAEAEKRRRSTNGRVRDSQRSLSNTGRQSEPLAPPAGSRFSGPPAMPGP